MTRNSLSQKVIMRKSLRLQLASRQKSASGRPSASTPTPPPSERTKKTATPVEVDIKTEVNIKAEVDDDDDDFVLDFLQNPAEEESDADLTASAEELFPWAREDSNPITRQVQMHLVKAYLAEHKSWTPEMRKEFEQIAPTMDYTICTTTGTIGNHKITRYARTHGATWTHFWFLRVMFGPHACARQFWFAELAEHYPLVMTEAPAGVVPHNASAIIESGLKGWAPGELSKEKPQGIRMSQSLRRETVDTFTTRPAKIAKPNASNDTGLLTDARAAFQEAGKTPISTLMLQATAECETKRLKRKTQYLELAYHDILNQLTAAEEKSRQQDLKLEMMQNRIKRMEAIIKRDMED